MVLAADGVGTLETMAEATRSRGYQYFGVADHSQSAHYAGGLGVHEVAEQKRRRTGSTGNMADPSAFLREMNPTSSRADRSITRTRCWIRSISWSQASMGVLS
jgi:histidinol phosphatase-like PHP family hydrolase